MMVTLRLYRQHDLDLITLYRNPSFSLPNAIKQALYAYVKKDTFAIKQPEIYELGEEKISKIIQMHIHLNEEIDSDIIAWLKNIKEGYRNSVLKNLIRAYMVGPCLYTYMVNKQTGAENALLNNVIFENNTKTFEELKKKAYRKSLKNNKKNNDNVADEILKENNKKSDKIFIERIADDDVDIKELENITKPEPKITQPEPVQEEVNKISETAESIEDILDDIDAMMDSL